MLGSAVKRTLPSLFFTSYGAGLLGSSPKLRVISSISRRARERTSTSFSTLPVSAKEPIGIIHLLFVVWRTKCRYVGVRGSSLCVLELDAGVMIVVERAPPS